MANSNSNSDFEEHLKTYERFVKLTKWVSIATAITLVLLYFIINP